jgi:hypothetical protein
LLAVELVNFNSALPFLVVPEVLIIPSVELKVRGMPSGMLPSDDVSPPWLLCVKSAVI